MSLNIELWVFNIAIINISVTSLRSISLVGGGGGLQKHHSPALSDFKSISSIVDCIECTLPLLYLKCVFDDISISKKGYEVNEHETLHLIRRLK